MRRCDFSTYEMPTDTYADDIGGVDNLGENFRTIFVVYSRTDGGILTPVPVLCVVRPKSSILVKGGAIAKMLGGEADPRQQGPVEGVRLDS